jgi:glycerol uptake facilitator-like aquaporin
VTDRPKSELNRWLTLSVGCSGGHLNPIVTFSLLLLRKVPLIHVRLM